MAAQTIKAAPTSKTELTTRIPETEGKAVDISADELEANLRKDIVVFAGNVEVRQADMVLNSDRVTVFYQKGKSSASAITRIDASGSVRLDTGAEHIQATWGIYDFVEKLITLGGTVILKQSNGEIKGTRLIYDLNSGLITIESNPEREGRVKGQFSLPDKTTLPEKRDKKP